MVEKLSVPSRNHFVIILPADSQPATVHRGKQDSVSSMGTTQTMTTTVRHFHFKLCPGIRLGVSFVAIEQQLFIVIQPIYILLQSYFSARYNLVLSFHCSGMFLK